MSQNNEYKNIKELVKSIEQAIQKMESGELNHNQLETLLDEARNLHERIAILHYLAIEKEVKKDSSEKNNIAKKKKKEKTENSFQGNFQLNFGTIEKPAEQTIEKIEEVHPNQINLIDAIEEQQVDIKGDEPVAKEVESNTPSVNEQFADQSEKTLAQKLSQQPITKLKEAIALNEKFLFMNDLFEGENTFYNEAIEQYDQFKAIDEANSYSEELKVKFNWDPESKSVSKFLTLVERRFLA